MESKKPHWREQVRDGQVSLCGWNDVILLLKEAAKDYDLLSATLGEANKAWGDWMDLAKERGKQIHVLEAKAKSFRMELEESKKKVQLWMDREHSASVEVGRLGSVISELEEKLEEAGAVDSRRDELALELAKIMTTYELNAYQSCKVAGICETAYEFADAMIEARKK